MSEESLSQTGLDYPCVIDVKVFLSNNPNNLELVRDVLFRIISSDDLLDIGKKESKNGNYESFSCKIRASDKQQMDQLFETLSSHPEVLMVI